MNSLLEKDKAYVWHPFTQAATAPTPLEVVKADGPYLELADGSRILDIISSWWTNLHGHSHPAIAKAIGEQAAKLDHVIFAGCTHPLAVELAERIIKLVPEGLARVFYSDNGSTSVEVGLKMAFQYWQNKGHPEKQEFISLEHAYHGDTIGAMSVGDPSEFVAPFRPLLFDVHHIPTPDRKTSEEACLKKLHDLLQERSSTIAAMIVEPMVQGAGGMRIQSSRFLENVAKLCQDHNVLLIADEVMTGFGRTGRMFACEHAGISPDILCIAKGLTGGVVPLAATIATEEIFQAFWSDDTHKAFLHGHSFTANPITCAAALASLDLVESNDILSQVATISQVYEERLPQLSKHPKVEEVRWLGCIGVVELKPATSEGGYYDTVGIRLKEEFLKNGILLRPLGNVVYTLPPYITPPQELHRVFDLLEELLSSPKESE